MFEIKNTMKDRPLLHLTLRVERSVYFEIKRRVKSAQSSTSQYLREMVHRELSTPKPIQNESGTN